MSLFSRRKPRGFNHRYIYYDERRERLRAIEERARRELGIEAPEEFRPEHLRGVFSGSMWQCLCSCSSCCWPGCATFSDGRPWRAARPVCRRRDAAAPCPRRHALIIARGPVCGHPEAGAARAGVC